MERPEFRTSWAFLEYRKETQENNLGKPTSERARLLTTSKVMRTQHSGDSVSSRCNSTLFIAISGEFSWHHFVLSYVTNCVYLSFSWNMIQVTFWSALKSTTVWEHKLICVFVQCKHSYFSDKLIKLLYLQFCIWRMWSCFQSWRPLPVFHNRAW